MAHIRDHTSTHSVTTANTESDFTHNVYINSLEEPLVVAWDYCALDATTSTTVLLTFDPVTLLQTELAEQRTQVAEVMTQNATLMAALSKGGRGGNSEGGRGGRSKDGWQYGGRHKTPMEREKPLSQLQQGSRLRSCNVFLP